MAAIQYAGTFIGMVISMSLSGILAQVFGWESVFYVYGVVGCIWYVLWLAIVRASPDHDRFISDEEKQYIKASLRTSANAPTVKNIPYRAIFTSTAVWAIAASHFSENWGVYTMLTQLPMFLKCKHVTTVQNSVLISIFFLLLDNLGFDLANSGFIAAIPYLTLGIILFVVGYLADWFQERKILTTSQVRRYFNCTAFVSQTIFLMTAAYQTNTTAIIVCITFGAALGALSICGYGVNHLDIAPQYASVLMGISNTVATIPGMVSPLIAGFIVTDQEVNFC
jgi:MFS transporter, ACS family, solute carrier family 17 (sodium-dependent inorganic phosphate cotransporter), other